MPAAPSAATALPGIEAEPTDPQHGRADDGEAEAMGQNLCVGIALAFADHDTRDECCDTRVDVYDESTRKVEHAHVAKEGTVTAPCHVADGRVHQNAPEHGEQEYG